MTHLDLAERKRLTSILGMLGSNAVGERDNAARLAEHFRREHGLTWAELLNLPIAPVAAPPRPTPEPPAWVPPKPRGPDVPAGKMTAEQERAAYKLRPSKKAELNWYGITLWCIGIIVVLCLCANV
jgi:hypothetical protein